MTLLTTRRTNLDQLGEQILFYRQLPRPHVALQVGLRPLEPIIDRIRATAEANGIAVAAADLRGIDADDVLWTIGTAIFRLIDHEPPVRPKDRHPAFAFMRLFDAVVQHSDEEFILIVGPIDDLEALPNVDDLYGALRATVVRFERRVQLVFLVKSWIIRQQVFWLDRPTESFASFVDLQDGKL